MMVLLTQKTNVQIPRVPMSMHSVVTNSNEIQMVMVLSIMTMSALEHWQAILLTPLGVWMKVN